MIRYQTDTDALTPGQLHGFFVGWPKAPTPNTHFRLLKQSDHVVVAIDNETGGVVGFITAISDGVLAAYIPFLEVLPTYQKRGIGNELVRRMLDHLKGFYMIDLVCDPELRPFYEAFGMQPTLAMVKRDFANQAGRPPGSIQDTAPSP